MSQSITSNDSGDNSSDKEEENVNSDIFKPFTYESYLRLLERERALKSHESKRAKHAQEAHLVDGELKFGTRDDDGPTLPPENPDLRDGAMFSKTFGKLPDHLLGVPIEELDPGIRQKTFIVISSRYKAKHINRFTATRSMFIFAPWNPVRRVMLTIATNQLFDVFIFMTIMVNCVFLAMPTLQISEKIERWFLGIYTLECIIKVVSRGFILNSYTYLRDPWNWLDFVVIATAFFTIMLQAIQPNMSIRSVQGLRTFRVLRALKTVSIVPGLKTLVSALLRAFRMLFEVILLTLFCLMIFAMVGLQLFMGVLRQKCVLDVSGYVSNPSETFDDYYARWIRNSDNWYHDDDDIYDVCGNNTGAGLCPLGYTCLPNVGDNPNSGFLSFDHFGWALLTCFQIITLDFWEDVYIKILRGMGPWNIIYFVVLILFGGFYLINLMLAVVSMSYEEEAVRAGREKEREKKENAQKKHDVYNTNAFQLKTKRSTSDTQGEKEAKVYNSVDNRSLDINESAKIHAVGYWKRLQEQGAMPSQLKSLRARIIPHERTAPVQTDQGVVIIKADVLLYPEIGILDSYVIDRNCDFCGRWMCYYVLILKIQNYFYMFVSDPLFDLVITLCIVTNTLFMSLEHHNQIEALSTTLNVANLIFTGVFFLEALCKIIGLGKYYFMVGWNIFDLIIVIASLLDLGLEQVDGLNVLRTFRLLRVLKLAQSWPTMRLLLTIILSTLGALGNLCLILVIVIYIFAVIGLQLFRETYTGKGFGEDGVPRWNFTDFYHSMLMIFRVLCGEFIEPLYQCMRASNELCFIIFLPALVFGNFIVLNLFLALLLNAFASDSLDRHRESSAERSKFKQGWIRLKQLFCCFCTGCTLPPATDYDEAAMSDSFKTATMTPPISVTMNVNENTVDRETNRNGKQEMNTERVTEFEGSKHEFNHVEEKRGNLNRCMNRKRPGSKDKQKHNSSEVDEVVNMNSCNSRNSEDIPKHSKQNPYEDIKVSAQNQSLGKILESGSSSFARKSDLLEKRKDQIYDFEADTSESIETVSVLTDCLPHCITSRLPFFSYLDNTEVGKLWTKFRTVIMKLVGFKTFEYIILLLIMTSSFTLVFEDIYLYQKPVLQQLLGRLDVVYSVLFTIEMILRWIGVGFHEYFTNFWTLLDFFIVVTSLLTLIGDYMGISNIQAFHSLRTLRALRPLRAISKWQGMKIVVNALMNAIPAIMNVFLVCMVFWLIFSIMGVQFFKGRFYKCVNQSSNEDFDYTECPNRTVCNLINGSWQNPNVNFDNAAIGFLALFQVATFEGWMEIMAAAVDATEVDVQPRYEASLYYYIYFVVFIVFGSFFSLNLFIGVIIDNFNVLKKRYEGSYLDAFLTQSQRNYYNTLKKLELRKPHKTIKRPQNKFQLAFYKLAVSSRFEMSIVLLIFLNMIGMAINHYKQTKAVQDSLSIMNGVFIVIFTLEAVVKIIGLRIYYFRSVWNIFDFIIVVFGLAIRTRDILTQYAAGITLNKFLATNFLITPSLLRIVRVFRIGRVLRLIKAAKGIRKLLFALIISLPAIFNIGALLFLVMFIYAIIGMTSFSAVKINGAFDEIVNFQTFGNSFMLLFRLATSAGWNDILDALLISVPNCNPHYYRRPDGSFKVSSTGECGKPYLAIPFIVSYIIIVWLIVVNMYIAVILENFNQAHIQEEVGITDDDFNMFYTVWEKYDPHATQFIKYEQLADFVNDLEPPLKIPKPNEIALVSFNLPIMEGDRMHCIDILVALVRNILQEVEESDELKALKLQMELKFARSFPSRVNVTVKSTTLQRKKEDVATRTLQRSWRSFKAQKAMRNITALAQKQKGRRTDIIGIQPPTAVMTDLGNRLNLAMDKFFDVHNEGHSLISSDKSLALPGDADIQQTNVS